MIKIDSKLVCWNFQPTDRAKEFCKNVKQDIFLHFAQVSDPQKSRNQYREILGQILSDYNLSR